MSHFDGFDDFLGFLDLFDRNSAADRWIGTVTTPGRFSIIRRHLRIIARVYIDSGKRSVRGIVHDITGLQPPPPPHLDSATLAGCPIPPTHALARIDLGTCLINRWLCPVTGPLEPWTSRNPDIDDNGMAAIARCCAELRQGATNATADLRIRFVETNPWLPVHAEWSALRDTRRPQAIIDFTTEHQP
ncbi:hypothetical protein [Nocardia terpenica]|uniref:Uncharacterized protein n=1 Tax=Nocardia terpenica TaxID=455432 RepID=A0A164PFG0_9NOCA|nr:hypothetical protein [Nocardia terpenica]KZM75497.1 hypothetical protein AWN90_19145 [Nocardia terpenica]